MKKGKIGIITAVAITSLTVGATASSLVEDISAQLRKSLKIVIDGQTQTFTDVNGQKVYPILYNGTTYLPLRAIGGIMGKPVSWDGATETVTLGETDAWKSVIAMPDKGNGYAGSKLIDATQLTFPYGETKEERTFQNAIRLSSINSAEKEFSMKLDGSYAQMSVMLYNPPTSKYPVQMEVKDLKTDIVLLSKSLEPGQFFEAKDVNLNSTDQLSFCAQGQVFEDTVVYFLEPQVR